MRRPKLARGPALSRQPLSRFSDRARADESIIKNPGDHPTYRFEAEPHGLIGFGGPFRGGRGELGAGFRGTVIIVDNGFVQVDQQQRRDQLRRRPRSSARATVFIPVAMQWNFWLSTHWSVFGEPGIGFAAEPRSTNANAAPPRCSWSAGATTSTTRSRSRCGSATRPSSVGASFFL